MKNSKRGFTLLELLVSMTVTVIVVGLLVFVARSAFSSLSTGTNDISSYQKAQLAMNQIASDLESMEFRENAHEWLVAEAVNTTAVFDASGADTYAVNTIFSNSAISNANTAGYFTRLLFFTKAQDRYNGVAGLPGNISAVEYGLSENDPLGGGVRTFVLYRQIVNPDYTFNNLLQPLTAAGTPDSILTVFDTARSQSVNAPPLFTEPCFLDDPSFLVCDNIKEFSLTFHLEYAVTDNSVNPPTQQNRITKMPLIEVNSAPNKTNKVETFTISGKQFTTTDNSGTANPEFVNALASGANIVAVDINLQVINDEGVALLNAGAPANVVEENVTRYTRTVNLPLLYGNSL